MAQQMTGAEMVIQALADQGVTDIFGYPGGAILHVYDELAKMKSEIGTGAAAGQISSQSEAPSDGPKT